MAKKLKEINEFYRKIQHTFFIVMTVLVIGLMTFALVKSSEESKSIVSQGYFQKNDL